TSVCPGRSRTSSYVSPTKPKGSGWSMKSPPAGALRCTNSKRAEPVNIPVERRLRDTPGIAIRKQVVRIYPSPRYAQCDVRHSTASRRPRDGTQCGGCVGLRSSALQRPKNTLWALLAAPTVIFVLVGIPSGTAVADTTDDDQEVTDFY